MSTIKAPTAGKGNFRKVIRKEVKAQLTASLADLKTILGEKKFNKRVKKAAKNLSAGIGLKSAKKTADKKVKSIKAPKVKVAPAESAAQ